MEPRHFARRLGAAVVDYLLAMVVGGLLLLPFLGDTDKVRMDAMIFTTSVCNSLTSAPDSLLAVVGGQGGGQRLCLRYQGVGSGQRLDRHAGL